MTAEIIIGPFPPKKASAAAATEGCGASVLPLALPGKPSAEQAQVEQPPAALPPQTTVLKAQLATREPSVREKEEQEKREKQRQRNMAEAQKFSTDQGLHPAAMPPKRGFGPGMLPPTGFSHPEKTLDTVPPVSPDLD
ncbi:MAG: hypothetical protein GC129_06220 [Proteobacteria bacterium]|nr:hypothetical protein [Pseudomonadota bacterium]